MIDAKFPNITTPEAPTHRRPRIEGLDVLRGAAALSVMMLHLTHDYNAQFHPSRVSSIGWTIYGSHGVTLFFMISGFVIFMTVERAKRPIDFVISRFSRLYPPYWVAVILTTATLICFPVLDAPAPKVLLRRAVVNLTMFQRWLHVAHIDAVYWTLQVEMSFYLIMLVLLWRKSTDRALAVMSGLVVLTIADHLFIPRPLGSAYRYVRDLFLIDNAFAFTAGIVFYQARRGWKSYYWGILLLCAASPASSWYWPHNPVMDTTITVGLAVVVYLASIGGLDFLTNRVFLYLGTISYSLYLTHHWIGVVIRDRLDRMGFHPDFTLFAAICACLSLASMMNLLVERPSLEWMRGRLRRLLEEPVADRPLAPQSAGSVLVPGANRA